MTEEETYWVWLANIEGIGPVTFYKILAKFAEIGNACKNMADIPKLLKLPEKTAQNILKCASSDFRDKILEKLDKYKINVITRLDNNYPAKLCEIDNAPPVLYFKGRMPEGFKNTCGMVGSRRPTHKGYDNAYKIASDLSEQDIIIVSGLARGVDSAAHWGTIKAKGFTIAVLGCGLNIIYPPENKDLFEKICENGAVISEYPPNAKPQARNFPLRNRIISGLSDALIVGEAGEKSGARITVDYALKQGKTVYVIPCDPKSSVAALPNYLLENGAQIIKHSLTVIQNEGWVLKRKIGDNTKQLELAADQHVIYQLLMREPLTADQLSEESQLPIKDINLILTYMEMRDLILPTEGDKFQLK